MSLDPLSFISFLEKYWHTKVGLLTALLAVTLTEASLLVAASASWPWFAGMLSGTSLVLVSAWFWSNKLPQARRNRIGFVVCIRCSDEAEAQQVREDFIVPLRRTLAAKETGRSFQFIEIPQHLAREHYSQEEIESLRQKTRAHFILYGRVRQRELDGGLHHVLELEGVVGHRPIPRETQQAFVREFSALLPRKVTITKKNDFLGFEFTSEWAGVVAQYVIGVASSFSGDFDYAEKLFRSANSQLSQTGRRLPIYAALRARIPIRIAEINETRAMLAYQQWYKTHESSALDEMEAYLREVPDSRRNSGAQFLRSILAFVKARDVRAARNHLKRIRGAADGNASAAVVGIWNCNMAFLSAYEGNLGAATRFYRRAALVAPLEPDLSAQIEDFLTWAIATEPNKYQLYYCLGLFNKQIKSDLLQAKHDFEQFLNLIRREEFQKEQRVVRTWLSKLDGPDGKKQA